MCTGSGILAVTIAKNVENSIVYAADISAKALDVAKENAKMHKVKIEFLESDLFQKIEEKNFDIIVSNPPYITKKDMENIAEEVKKEPQIALYGGIDGLDFYKKIADKSKQYLKSGGQIFFEIGYNQEEKVKTILKENHFKNIKSIKDLQGIIRVIIGEKE